MKVELSRGYACEFKEEQASTTEIDVLGNYSKSGYNATPIVGTGGVVPTIRENHGQVTAIYETYVGGQKVSNLWLSDAGKRYALSPKRGMCTDFNAEICQTLTARGQSNDTGSFVSPDIKRVIKSTEIGGVKPVKIETNDGKTFTNEDEEEVARLRIRKLTPKECTRLMGFQDCDYEVMKSVNSDSQIYKQCGNSIVVNVLTAIFGQMFEGKEDIYKNDYER